MNTVFFQLKNEFEPSDDYSGTDVVNTILNVVRVREILLFYFSSLLPITLILILMFLMFHALT